MGYVGSNPPRPEFFRLFMAWSPRSLRAQGSPKPQRARRLLLGACLLPLAIGTGWAGLSMQEPAQAAAPTEGSFWANFEGMALVDQDGRPLRTERLAGHLVLVNFVFTGCSTVCPMQTRALAELQERLPATLRKRVRLLSISLDPLTDSPAALKAFAERMGADLSSWRFATGRHEDIERLSEALRLFRPDSNLKKPDDHSTALWLVDAHGELRMRYSGNPPDIPRLLRELPALDRLDQLDG